MLRYVTQDIECAGLMGKLFGHKFEARYHSEPTDHPKTDIDGYRSIQAFYDHYTKHTYIHDVCTRCGLIVKQDNFTGLTVDEAERQNNEDVQ